MDLCSEELHYGGGPKALSSDARAVSKVGSVGYVYFVSAQNKLTKSDLAQLTLCNLGSVTHLSLRKPSTILRRKLIGRKRKGSAAKFLPPKIYARWKIDQFVIHFYCFPISLLRQLIPFISNAMSMILIGRETLKRFPLYASVCSFILQKA